MSAPSEADLHDEDADDEPEVSEHGLAAALVSLLSELAVDPDDLPFEFAEFAALTEACEFADRGLLTRDAGVVVNFADGSEFQVTIVRSR